LNKARWISFTRIIFVVEYYFANKSCVLCQEVFPNEAVRNKTTVHRLIKKFRETDSECNREDYYHRPTVITEDTLKNVNVLQSPSKPVRKL